MIKDIDLDWNRFNDVVAERRHHIVIPDMPDIDTQTVLNLRQTISIDSRVYRNGSEALAWVQCIDQVESSPLGERMIAVGFTLYGQGSIS